MAASLNCDFIYEVDNWENTFDADMLEHMMADCDGGQVVEIGRLKALPPMFALSFGGEVFLFASLARAQAALKKAAGQ